MVFNGIEVGVHFAVVFESKNDVEEFIEIAKNDYGGIRFFDNGYLDVVMKRMPEYNTIRFAFDGNNVIFACGYDREDYYKQKMEVFTYSEIFGSLKDVDFDKDIPDFTELL